MGVWSTTSVVSSSRNGAADGDSTNWYARWTHSLRRKKVPFLDGPLMLLSVSAFSSTPRSRSPGMGFNK